MAATKGKWLDMRLRERSHSEGPLFQAMKLELFEGGVTL